MGILDKIKWIAGILLIFIVILFTNLIDKESFRKLNESATSIYEDRVVASDLIFEITIRIQEKEIAMAISDSLFLQTQNDNLNQEIQGFVDAYEGTKLTQKEEKLYNNLKKELDELYVVEQQFFNSGYKNHVPVFERIDNVIHYLYDLSKVQLEEGRRQMKISNKAMDNVKLFTQIEVVFLIIMAILIQVIILYKPKKD
jgi:hypothetical protein